MFLDFARFDDDYVDKLRSGDQEVLRHFVVHFGHLIEIKLRSRLRSRTLVDDARQETFLRVFATIRNPSKRQPENLGAFVNAVCNNVVFELYRAEARTPSSPENAPELVDLRPNPETEVVNADRKRMVELVLEELSPRDRSLIRGVFLEELDRDELCRQHQVDNEYLRVLVHRAKGRFRTLFEGIQRRTAAGSGSGG